jgi:serine/threonine protein kinase
MSSSFHERYEIQGELGRGGMGIVYEARDRSRDAPVVIKTLLQTSSGAPLTERDLARFELEARALAALRHKHILPIHDFGRLQGYPYMVLPRIQGRDWQVHINEAIAAGELIDLDRCLRILGQVAEALEWCHAQGIVHRDLKPANILIENESPEAEILHERALLADFGLARDRVASEGEQSAERLTLTGEVLGTPHYMAPELFDSALDDALADKADVWAFGVLIYFSLTGLLPFTGNAVELSLRVAGTTPTPISRINAAVPAWLVSLVSACLRKDPRLRPSMKQLRLALHDRRWSESSSPLWLWLSLVSIATLIAAFALTRGPSLPSRPIEITELDYPKITNRERVELRGRALQAREIQVSIAGRAPSLWTVADDGLFRGTLSIPEGESLIRLRARNGARESLLAELRITLDSEPPSLTWQQPSAIAFDPSVVLWARVSEEGCQLIFGERAFSGSGAEIEAKIDIPEGRSEQAWCLRDRAGNETRGQLPLERRRTLRVSSEGPFHNIRAALNEAQDGERILLSPGTYTESIELDKPVIIEGQANVTVTTRAETTVSSSANGATLRSLRLLAPQGSFCSAVYVPGGRLTIEDCELEATGEVPALLIGRAADPLPTEVTVQRSSVSGSAMAGVYVISNAKASFTKTRFLTTGHFGLQAKQAQRVELDDCEFSGSEHSIGVDDGFRRCEVIVRRSRFLDARFHHVLLRGEGSRLELVDSSFQNLMKRRGLHPLFLRN